MKWKTWLIYIVIALVSLYIGYRWGYNSGFENGWMLKDYIGNLI